MNDFTPEQSDARQLDRLVDGELNASERQALLLRLESEPGGWRRCALAFLEAQCWRDGLDAILRPEQPMRITPAAISVALPNQRRWNPTTFFAMAASFLLAFGLGLFVRRDANPALPGAASLAGATAAVEPFNEAGGFAGVVPGSRALAGAPAPRVMLKLASTGEGVAQQEVPLPVLAPEELSRQWSNHVGAALPAEMLRQLGRLGHRVQRVRELVPVRLDDGTPAEVPVEGFQIHYVGDRYQ